MRRYQFQLTFIAISLRIFIREFTSPTDANRVLFHFLFSLIHRLKIDLVLRNPIILRAN